jgi:hypothetical protein
MSAVLTAVCAADDAVAHARSSPSGIACSGWPPSTASTVRAARRSRTRHVRVGPP